MGPISADRIRVELGEDAAMSKHKLTLMGEVPASCGFRPGCS